MENSRGGGSLPLQTPLYSINAVELVVLQTMAALGDGDNRPSSQLGLDFPEQSKLRLDCPEQRSAGSRWKECSDSGGPVGPASGKWRFRCRAITRSSPGKGGTEKGYEKHGLEGQCREHGGHGSTDHDRTQRRSCDMRKPYPMQTEGNS